MGEKISLTMSARVSGGLNLSMVEEIEIDAYDKIEVLVEASGAKTVEVQPNAGDKVLFLLIRSDRYGADLTYQVNGAGDDVSLDTPQVFIGKGSVSRLGAAPESLAFANNLVGPDAGDASIEVLVGRNAVT